MVREPAPGPPLVLIIDDQEADRYILRHYLDDFRCSIVEATGGEEGLKLARQLKPALILLDLNMPKIDGFEVLAQLKADAETASLLVVIVTSHVLAPEQTTALGHARAVLMKHELSPATWQRVFHELGLTTMELSVPETLKPS